MDTNELIALDLQHLWHPAAQMKDYETFPPLAVESARGPFLYTKDGREVIDAISSWWCKSLGHCHPRIRAAVDRQLDKFEHVILANTTNETIALFAAKLAGICPGLDRVFLADNGSTAVEVAMKMSLQYHLQTGKSERNTFVALHNGYHADHKTQLPYRTSLRSVIQATDSIRCGLTAKKSVTQNAAIGARRKCRNSRKNAATAARCSNRL